MVKLNTDKVDIMAFKKAEGSDYYIVRVNGLYGKNANGVSRQLHFNFCLKDEILLFFVMNR
ncbi:MAG: hypothetical protein M1292_01355 [Bacteroidetes bacterium]|nr:hypothetical protein [Bacteroidota bacterium]